MALSVSTAPQLPWEPLKTFQRTYWQPRIAIDRRCCGNDPFILLRPRLRAASMHRIPCRADQVVFRYHVWFDRRYWE